MDLKDTLAINIRALMAASGMTENAFTAHYKLPKSNFRKMRLSEADPRVGTVEEVAQSLKLRACDLLDPDLARRMAAGEPLRMGEPRPPVMPDEQWRALSPRARAFVEELCQQAIAGSVTDADISWLHDSLNRASGSHGGPRASAIATGQPPGGKT